MKKNNSILAYIKKLLDLILPLLLSVCTHTLPLTAHRKRTWFSENVRRKTIASAIVQLSPVLERKAFYLPYFFVFTIEYFVFHFALKALGWLEQNKNNTHTHTPTNKWRKIKAISNLVLFLVFCGVSWCSSLLLPKGKKHKTERKKTTKDENKYWDFLCETTYKRVVLVFFILLCAMVQIQKFTFFFLCFLIHAQHP